VPPEQITPGNLADAYWENHVRREALDAARPAQPYDPAAGDRVVTEGDGWQVIAQKHREDTPEDPGTGLEWAWDMVDCIASARTWDGAYDGSEGGREARLPPAIDRLELLELLAETAPDEEALGSLGAGHLEDYLAHLPDVDRVEAAALRSERFRKALAGAWYDRKLPPQDVARLRRFGGAG